MELPTTQSHRLLSLDFFRGMTMFLLIGEFTGIFEVLVDPFFEGGIIYAAAKQFHHHPWNGLRFWDLIQPFFMFIVGVAIPFSVRNREKKGESQASLLTHAVKRSFLLLLLGWALYCIDPGKITFRFQNVLAQLSITYLVAFLLRNKSWQIQLGISLGILLLTEIIYQTFGVTGFDQAYTPDQNFGAYVDLLISGELSGGHWVSFNAIPTTAHSIWGVLTGLLLMSDKSSKEKMRIMLMVSLIAIVVGYAMNPLIPIIKRISTSSFVIVSGAWSVLAMAASYWLIDVKGYKKWVPPFAIVGMNPLFIYLFAHVGGASLIKNIVKPFTYAFSAMITEIGAEILTTSITWYLLWYICYWMYKRDIFIRI